MHEYESWKESLSGNATGWTIKYYKGLGTSTSKEGKEYFESLDLHKKDFVWEADQDGEAIELAFSKNKIEARKNWLLNFEGGKDAASARYIFTMLSPATRVLFPKDDDVLLNYLNEDGQTIEPTWYMPIIPTVLVNGCEGIGTGWSSFISNYNLRDIVANVRRILNGESMA